MKFKKNPNIFFVFMFVLSIPLYNVMAQVKEQKNNSILIQENKNQWPQNVLFQASIKGGNVFFEKNELTYLLTENKGEHHHYNKNTDALILKNHAWKVKFIGSNPFVEHSGEGQYPFHYNYYRGNDPKQWAENVKVYEGVNYHEIYKGVDVHFYSEAEHFKYDFILQPGADYRAIKMQYLGIDKMYLENGNLHLTTSLGEVIEQKPYAYQQINGNKIEVPCSYKLDKNTVVFKITAAYNIDLPLIIDPVLIACTYTGSTSDNWGFTSTYDLAGNIYTGGVAFGLGYPTTTGAYQTTYGGGGMGGNPFPFDITITKYNPTGTAMLYSTFFGGSDNEQPHSLIVNGAGELFVAGRTYSSNFPVTNGSYDQSFNGGSDIIMGKFSSTGALLASTFIGGSSEDGVNGDANETSFTGTKFSYADDGRSEIMLDNAGNVYLAASTFSTDFPTSSGAYDVSLAGPQDGCVIKMDPALSTLIFSTYLGGANYDAAYGIKIDANNDVYVTGATMSSDFPSTSGVIHPTFQGGTTDGFITVLNSTGTSVLRSTFLGTSAFDQSYFIERDANNDIYVFGLTMGAYPVSAGVYSNAGSSQFIHKLNPSLTTTLFSTVIGNGTIKPNISPTAFLVDSCQNIYIAGWGRCAAIGSQPSPSDVNNMPITANAQQSTTDGCDFYFMVLTTNATALWYATYFGENGIAPDHVDGGTSRFDSRGFIYQSVCASCGGTQSFPTTAGAWSAQNKSNNCNNAVIKMDMSLKPKANAIFTGNTSGCAPYTIQLNNNGSSAMKFTWDFGDGSPIQTANSVTHTYSVTGDFTITLTAIDTIGKCKLKDSTKIKIKVGAPPVIKLSSTNIKCNGDSDGTATVTTTGGYLPYSYLWNPGNQTTPTINGLGPGKYVVVVKDGLTCTAIDSVTIKEPPALFLSVIDSTDIACYGAKNGTATAAGGGGTGSLVYSWNTVPVKFGTNVSALDAGLYTVTLTDSMGCKIEKKVNIKQNPAIVITDKKVLPTCGKKDGSIAVFVTGGVGPYTYQWSTVPALTTSQINNLGIGTYTVVVKDALGCSKTFTDSITRDPNTPLADFDYSPTYISIQEPTVEFKDMSKGNIISWDWSFGDAHSGNEFSSLKNPSHVYPDTGKYCIRLVVTDIGQICKDTVLKCLIINPEFTFYVPNAFTPNNDGHNEAFTGYGMYVKYFKLYVFDRWGELIYDTDDMSKGWDGKVSNGYSKSVAQEDVYIWKIYVTSTLGKKYNYVGRVTLVR